MLIKKVALLNNTLIGRFLFKISSNVRCVLVLACLNILCTAMLGFMMTYPLYIAGGVWPALPTTLLTILLVMILTASILSHRLEIKNPLQRTLLTFAILFSLPFGILSLPLLHRISSNEESVSELDT